MILVGRLLDLVTPEFKSTRCHCHKIKATIRHADISKPPPPPRLRSDTCDGSCSRSGADLSAMSVRLFLALITDTEEKFDRSSLSVKLEFKPPFTRTRRRRRFRCWYRMILVPAARQVKNQSSNFGGKMLFSETICCGLIPPELTVSLLKGVGAQKLYKEQGELESLTP